MHLGIRGYICTPRTDPLCVRRCACGLGGERGCRGVLEGGEMGRGMGAFCYKITILFHRKRCVAHFFLGCTTSNSVSESSELELEYATSALFIVGVEVRPQESIRTPVIVPPGYSSSAVCSCYIAMWCQCCINDISSLFRGCICSTDSPSKQSIVQSSSLSQVKPKDLCTVSCTNFITH